MNYLKELNAFYSQIIFNPLSGSAVALWNTLMHFNNLSGWQATFSVPVSAIELKSGIKGTSFKRARDELQEKGFINVTSGSGNQAATYEMISQIRPMQQREDLLSEQLTPAVQNEPAPVPTDDQSPVNNTEQTPANSTDSSSDHNSDHSSAPLFKQDLKQDKTKHKPTTTTAVAFFEENFDKASSYIKADINSSVTTMGEPLVMDAMQRALEQNKPTWRYAKGILRAWQNKGITTIEQAVNDEVTFRSRQQYKPRQNTSEKGEVIPDWFKKRKQGQANLKQAQQASETQAKTTDWETCEQLLAKYRKKGPVGV